MSETTQNIIKTITFFDLCSFPLTPLEVWKYLPIKQDFQTTQNNITELVKLGRLEQQAGFYFLPEHSNLIIERQKRYSGTFLKYRRARRVAKLLAILPWIKLICLVNQKGPHNLRANGDLDFFIVCQGKRIWLTRWFSVGLLKLFNLRPQPNNIKNKICLSFLVDTDNLNLQPFLLPLAESNQDWVFIYYLANFAPLLNRDNTWTKFLSANHWLTQILPNNISNEEWPQLEVTAKACPLFYLFNPLEKLIKKIQLLILPSQLKNKMNQGTEVVINDGVLKLHSGDRRQDFNQNFQDKLEQILNV